MTVGERRDHGFGFAAEIATNRPSDCGTMAETSRAAVTARVLFDCACDDA
jgi:hypothetical protein